MSNYDYIRLSAVIMTLIGCSSMLMSFVWFKKLRSSFDAVSMWFALSGIGNSLYILIGHPRDGSAVCYIQSIIGSYFALSQICTSTIIVHTIYRMFYPLDSTAPPAKLLLTQKTALYVWGVPLIFSLIPFTTESYGLDENINYCWINTEDGNNKTAVALVLSTYYAPIFVGTLFNSVVYSLIWRKVYEIKKHAPMQTPSSLVIIRTADTLKWYPIISIFCWALPLVSRIGEALGWSSDIVTSMKVFLFYIPGFLFSIVYFMKSKAKNCWKHWWFSKIIGVSVDYDSSQLSSDFSDTGLNKYSNANKTNESRTNATSYFESSVVVSTMHEDIKDDRDSSMGLFRDSNATVSSEISLQPL